MSGQKPNVSLYFKDKKTGKFVNFAAFWTDNGRPSGGLDKKITRVKIELEGGEVVVIANPRDREQQTHYLNLNMGQASAKPAPQDDDDNISF